MRQSFVNTKDTAEKTVRDIRRKTRKQYSAEEKIRIVLAGLRGEESIAGREDRRTCRKRSPVPANRRRQQP